MQVSKKVIIVYGTRYGATEGTSEEIAKVLRDTGLDVRVVNAKIEKTKDISEYDFVIVGSGMQMARWTGAAENFLKSSRKSCRARKWPFSYPRVHRPRRKLKMRGDNISKTRLPSMVSTLALWPYSEESMTSTR